LTGPDAVVLDFGAGRGARGGASQIEDPALFRRNLMTLKGRVRELIGADVDPVVKLNSSLDRAILLGPDGRLPLPDASIDVIVSDYTFEHVQDPAKIARELDRVLVPGGWICVRTPNRYGYIALANRMVPERLSHRVVRLAQRDRKDEDIFPAVYRLIPQRPSRSTSRGYATIITSFRGTPSPPITSDRSCSTPSRSPFNIARQLASRLF
jgi:SAM-dependent methyltransferase